MLRKLDALRACHRSQMRARFRQTLRRILFAGLFADMRTVHCILLGTEAEGLDYVPYPGELGQRIYENVSKEAWQRWVQHQTMLLNEYRLSPIDPKARKFLVAEMEKFFFAGGSEKPADFMPPK